VNPAQQNNPQPDINLLNPVHGNLPQAEHQPAQPAAQTKPQNEPQAKPVVNPNSTQNTLQIAEIRDGIVIMNDGSFRAVAMFKSINFDLMSPAERESVEYAYQSFLNSLYFPVQIFVRSERIDMQPYMEKLQKIQVEHDNMLLAILMANYIDYIDQLSSQTNIMDKHFYLVIPFLPSESKEKALTSSKNILGGVIGLFSRDTTHLVINETKLAEAKTELRNRVQLVLNGLNDCGVKGLPLDTQELIELYYDAYNPDTATRQHLKNFDDLTVPVVTKGEGQAPQPGLDKELED
jgi:type IV secretory pathway VirB4 component